MAHDAVRLWLGTSPESDDAVHGVWSVDLDPATGALGEPVLRARTPAPSFLALTPDGRSLFAAGETAPGAVTRFAVGPDGTLTQRERVSSGGSGPCHLLLHPAGHALYVANYGSGSVGVLPLRAGADGTELVGGVAQVFEHAGRGPVRGRQEGPHVHATTLAPDGSVLYALDLGTDEIRRYRLHDDGTLDAEGVALRLPPGTGPRHAAWVGDRLAVTGELDVAVHVLAHDDGGLRPVAAVPVGVPAGPDEVLAAHVVADVPGTVDDVPRLLVSVRGPDVLVALRPGADAPLEVAGACAAGVAWPRHFAVVPGVAPGNVAPGNADPGGAAIGWLVVAGQRADAVVVLPADGGDPVARVSVPAPTCVVVSPTGRDSDDPSGPTPDDR